MVTGRETDNIPLQLRNRTQIVLIYLESSKDKKNIGLLPYGSLNGDFFFYSVEIGIEFLQVLKIHCASAMRLNCSFNQGWHKKPQPKSPPKKLSNALRKNLSFLLYITLYVDQLNLS